ncbi:VCBS repeat-containing protein [Dyadobacter sp. UP-52]|uniref:VCBS repeat-containing protein n=2 Tax=Dyadobacter subterraneus TaxID=2773304 RepID=A0ABR9WN77_9BACT|nr:VCBS repeat-containing protein [Dyadobacter subterraneus]
MQKIPYTKPIVISFISIWIFSFSRTENENHTTITSPDLIQKQTSDSLTGKELAGQYCQSCHILPDPSLLDKNTWITSVLPNMGLRLGVKSAGRNPYQDLPEEEKKRIRDLDIYPENQIVSDDEWAKIVAYFELEAPAMPLPQRNVLPITANLPLFKTQEIMLGDKPFPQTTLLKFDKSTSRLYVGDAQNTLYILDNQFNLKETKSIDSPPTDIDFPAYAAPRLLMIGSFKPSEQRSGRLLSLALEQKTKSSYLNIEGLHRPVQFVSSDINMDGKEDALICEFGNHSGKLFWYDNFQPTKEHVLKAFPGARKVEIADFNHDKKPDVMVLMAQAREEMAIFYNLGNGKFQEKTLMRFQPLFGASYFELTDFNQDGFQDILLTNGDNWDYSAVKKNYHGVRIYLNDGKDNFKQMFFYPLYGTSKAIARDFDNDGDIDLAAISFYTELDNPEQRFIYLSNEGELHFKAFSTPAAANGKWLTMDAADFDHDGDQDIVLGSYFHNLSELTTLIFQGITSFPQLLVLTNGTK